MPSDRLEKLNVPALSADCACRGHVAIRSTHVGKRSAQERLFRAVVKVKGSLGADGVTEVDDVVLGSDAAPARWFCACRIGRTVIGVDRARRHGDVGRSAIAKPVPVRGFVIAAVAHEIPGVIKALLLDIGENEQHPRPPATAFRTGRQAAEEVVILVHRQTDLPQIVRALSPSSGFAPAGMAGIKIAMTRQITAITTRSSTKVNATGRSFINDLVRNKVEFHLLDGLVGELDR